MDHKDWTLLPLSSPPRKATQDKWIPLLLLGVNAWRPRKHAKTRDASPPGYEHATEVCAIVHRNQSLSDPPTMY